MGWLALGGVMWICSIGQAQETNAARRAYARAQELSQAGILYEAVHQLEAYLEEVPEDRDARLQAAELFFALGLDRAAADHASRLYSANRADQKVRRLMVRIRSRLATGLDDEDREEVLYLARLSRLLGNEDRALHYYQRALSLQSTPELQLELARSYVWMGRPRQALGVFREYMRTNPDDYAVQHEWGRLYNALGNHAEAADVLTEALRLKPDDADIALDRARAFHWDGRTEESISQLDQVLALDPGHVEALWLMARIRDQQGAVRKAAPMLRRLLEEDPNHEEAEALYARYEWEDRVEIEQLENVVDARPDDQHALKRLARLYMRHERYQDARQPINQLLLLRPGDDEVSEWQARLRRHRSAQEERGIEILHEQMATARQSLIRAFRVWTRYHPGDGLSRYSLGEHLTRAGRHMEAFAVYQQVASDVPDHPLVALRLDRLRDQLGRRHPARDAR